MKKQLLALSMVAATSLMAQADAQNQCNTCSTCNTCDTYCSDCCCDSCCCTNPRPCVGSESYVPAFHNLECDYGFFVDLEFLLWYARESNIPYANILLSISNGDVAGMPENVLCPSDPISLDAEWDPGVRAGLGWNMGCDGWDLYLNWTYYNNTSSRSSSTPEFTGDTPRTNAGEQAILSNYTAVIEVIPPFYANMSARWRNRFNQIDLVLGRKYWLSRCFTMRPYAGLRGAWTRTRLSLNATDGPKEDLEVFIQSSMLYRDRNWGVGFVGGIEPTFYFTDCFAFYANIGLSAIWGNFEENRSESLFQNSTNGIARNFSCDFSYEFSTMNSIIDTGIGIRWEQTWCCDRYRTALDLGWEHHIWNSHSFRFNGLNIVSSNELLNTFVYDVSDLGYGGLVIRAKWDF